MSLLQNNTVTLLLSIIILLLLCYYHVYVSYIYDLVYVTSRVPYTSDMNATRVHHEQNEWWDTSNLSATLVLHEQHECNMSGTRVKTFDFDNDTSENIFSLLYISSMANERLKGEEQFHSKNYLLDMPHSYVKMRLKSTPQRLNFVMAKAISKSYTLDRSFPRTFSHSYA